MEKTFDHLLGLNVRSALAILASYGITGVRVTQTGAPPIVNTHMPACPPSENISALEGINREFAVGDDEDAQPFDPLLDPELDNGMLVEARVVAVRDDGRQLIVARFHVGQPKADTCETP